MNKIFIGSNDINLAHDFYEVTSTFERFSPDKFYKKMIKENEFNFIIRANKQLTHFNFLENYSFGEDENDKGPSSILIDRFKGVCELFEDRLLFVLFRFPYGFKNTFQTRQYLAKLIQIFDQRIAFEFQNDEFRDFYPELIKKHVVIVGELSSTNDFIGRETESIPKGNNNIYLISENSDLVKKYQNQAKLTKF